MTLRISGPITITVKGPQGSGKTQIMNLIADFLETQGLTTVTYSAKTAKIDRLWRKPYSTVAASVMLLEKQD